MLLKLFDFIFLRHFKNWFRPHDLQTAYQDGKSGSDHIFLLRCIVQWCKSKSEKIFITAVDFDVAFDRAKRSTLLTKLVRFGASALFVARLANMYSISRNVIYSNGTSVTYIL